MLILIIHYLGASSSDLLIGSINMNRDHLDANVLLNGQFADSNFNNPQVCHFTYVILIPDFMTLLLLLPS
jgi:hypothetical protein